MSSRQYTEEELARIYQVARNVHWRYKLDQYEDEVVKSVAKTVDLARSEVTSRMDRYLVGGFSHGRGVALLGEFDRLTVAVRGQLTRDILGASASVGEYALAEHADILSFGGKVATFNNVALSAAQFQSFFRDTPLGDASLAQWVDRSFDSTVRAGMLETLRSGVLQGEGTPNLVRRIRSDFELTKREAVNLVRTYVQSANVVAQETVYAANGDILNGVEWCATLEKGYKSTGRGTCLRCSALDGTKYAKTDKRPPMPLHIRCRCLWLPVTKSFRELGVDIDEVERVARPYTIRPNQNIDVGGKRAILEQGFHDGDYSTWFERQSPAFKRSVVGPGRFELLGEGKISFKDLVDRRDGHLFTLGDLRGKSAGAVSLMAPEGQ